MTESKIDAEMIALEQEISKLQVVLIKVKQSLEIQAYLKVGEL